MTAQQEQNDATPVDLRREPEATGLIGLLLRLPWNRWLAGKIGLRWFKRLMFGGLAVCALAIGMSFVMTAAFIHSVHTSPPMTPSAPARSNAEPAPASSTLLVQETRTMSAERVASDLVYLRSLAYCDRQGRPDPAVLTYLYQFKDDPDYQSELNRLNDAQSSGKSLCLSGGARPTTANTKVVSRTYNELVVDYDLVVDRNVVQRYEAKLYWSAPLWYAASISAIA